MVPVGAGEPAKRPVQTAQEQQETAHAPAKLLPGQPGQTPAYPVHRRRLRHHRRPLP
ncbi:conserved protein of unknown function [Pseudomonas inefficax]|uniref:Uncharacterized protein n=1 Tax=Pseudomonas inefficax TaxID=2078786 RepID=A0AAQ1STY2_9PSED|nr:conserved protein of unknown function [Pseudomonas inefficax]